MTEPTELLPCPFCGAGESQIHVNKGTWNGRGYGEPVSVEVRHWCADVPGQPSRMISRAGRDEASAIAAWNTRTTPQPTQSVLAQAAPQPAVPALEDADVLSVSKALFLQREADAKDAERWRWLTFDHVDANTRNRVRELIVRLPVMSYSAACADIDASRAQAKEGGAA